MTDRDIIEKILAGETEQFRLIVDKYKDKVLNIIYSFCGYTGDAEDIAQNAFVKVFYALEKFNFDSSFSTWLYRIVINESITMAKKRNGKYRYVPLETSGSDAEDGDRQNIDFIKSDDNIEEKIWQKDMTGIINKLIRQLKENYRTVLILRDIEDFSYNEIADMLDISVERVKVLLFRARNKMKELILKRGNIL